MDNYAQKTSLVAVSPEFAREIESMVERTRLNWESRFPTSRPAPDVIHLDTNVWAWCKFLGQTLVETNNIQKVLFRPKKRMVRRAKPPRPVMAPIVVPDDFERDITDAKTRINYMMHVRLKGGVGALIDTYYHVAKYPEVEIMFALQRLRKKFPELVLGRDERKLWKKIIGREPNQ